MKFIHLGDIHIGKRVNDFPMIKDQEYILNKIIDIAESKYVDAVLIAGDVYDKAVPAAEAVTLFDEFITALADKGIKVYIISGNHDSAERLVYAGSLIRKNGVYISPVFDGTVTKEVYEDEYGPVNIYMLPFIKPIQVKRFSEEENDKIISYNDAYKVVMNEVELDTSQRNIILAHQFVTGAKTCDSEELAIGGMDNISSDNFDGFDYVALGHIHSPQKIVKETIRYSGTPLKYSLSEMNHRKSVTLVEIKDKKVILDALKNNESIGVKVKNINSEELKEKNHDVEDKNSEMEYINIEQIPLTPLHEMRHIKGTYSEITLRENYKDTDTDDYMYITLTDEEDIPDAIGRLRSIYPNIMKLDYDNTRTRKDMSVEVTEKIDEKKPIELFAELYELQNNQNMTDEQEEYMMKLIENVWEG